MSMQIQTIESMPFAENTYLVWQEGQPNAVVIDPGLEPGLILDFLEERSLRVAAILNTHGHTDHIAGNATIKQAFPDAPILIGVQDAPLLTDARANLSAKYGFAVTSPPADKTLQDGDILNFAGITFEVREIPGHSVGHVVFVVRGQPAVVFGGDVLFRGSIGRYDFPGGSFEQLSTGIREKLFTLPPDTVVYPGHGPVTTTGHEQKTNPFVGDSAS
jgi:glyoxylase-like metal-dependent hydrolase (beta-lactamase superfamily II)